MFVNRLNSFLSNVTTRLYKEENVVLLTWKKYCHHDDYRNPANFAVELLKKHSGSNFICDARNGFEDHQDDVEWGFKVYLPSMAESDCEKVVFIMNEVNDIEEEMDMWTKEFNKYFVVKKVVSYEDGVNFIKEH